MNYTPRRSVTCRRSVPYNNGNVFIVAMTILWIVFIIAFVINNYLLLQLSLQQDRILHNGRNN